MTHYRFTWLLAAVLLFGVAACTDTGDLEERVAALEARPEGMVVARHFEMFDGDITVTTLGGEMILEECLGEGICHHDYDPIITVSFGTFARELLIEPECYLLVRVGDPWPSDHDACR